MYRDKKISLVIPARNEERLIVPTLEGVPALVDDVYVVDDGSHDRTREVVAAVAREDRRVHLIAHETNRGPGAAIISGYRAAAAGGCDIAVVVGGDNQMPLDQIERFLDPIADGRADYVKGNRFIEGEGKKTFDDMPRIRLVGNIVITALTKMASGYYKIMDVVEGYTAISREAIERVDWDRAWKGYGYPMNFLIHLNCHGMRMVEVPRRAIYLPGERQSQIRGVRYALRVAPMLLRGFWWRIATKYFLRSFHPVFLFYVFGMVLSTSGLGHGFYLISQGVLGLHVPGPQSILCALLLITGSQLLLFAMLLDMEESHRR